MTECKEASPEEACSMNPDAPEGIAENEASKGGNKEEDSGITSNTSSNGEGSAANGEEGPADLEGHNAGGAEKSGDKEFSPLDSSQSETHSKAEDDQFTSPFLRWYNPIRNFCGKIVKDTTFQLLIVLFIIANGLMSKCITQKLLYSEAAQSSN
jgi:hypothetical protein